MTRVVNSMQGNFCAVADGELKGTAKDRGTGAR